MARTALKDEFFNSLFESQDWGPVFGGLSPLTLPQTTVIYSANGNVFSANEVFQKEIVKEQKTY